ncbi:MATE family efflux transporter [Gracilibacillus sp. Marseille-QA3620]
MNIKKIINNFFYALLSNLITLLISSLVILIVPKLIGIEDYGYWQLYLFYSSYVGLFQFGWNDGIYLRYGGVNYKDLDKSLFYSQFWMLMFFQLTLAGILIINSFVYVNNQDRLFILVGVAFCLVIAGVKAMLLFILQATNRIKENSLANIWDRLFYSLLIIILLSGGIKDYKLLILADLIGKTVSFVILIYYCKEIVLRRISDFYISIQEAIRNINAGVKLTLANIASMLIVGIVRFGIERTWDVSTFGKVSLTLSISNLMMTFINAMGMIMFPILRRTDQKLLPDIYKAMRTLLMVPLLGMLVIFYPLKVILTAWLPQYAESLMYMALLFPICVFEGKMSLLINTYLKTLRKEKVIMYVNLISVFLSLFTTVIFTILLRNLTLTVLSIVILIAFRCILAEVLLSKILHVTVHYDIFLEVLLSAIFILTGWFVGSWEGIVLYLFSYLIYLFLRKREISETVVYMKKILK